MDEKIIKAKRTLNQKVYEAKVKVERATKETINWVKENPQTALTALVATAGVVKGVTRMSSRALTAYATNKEIKFKERTIYDHSLGRYVELKHKLTPTEALTIEERRANGEKLHMILNDMNLLKK